MSSLYKRKLKSGEVWYGQVRLKNGRWKAFNTGCTSKRAAQVALEAVQVEIQAGRDPWRKQVEGSRISEVSEQYLRAIRDRLRRSTLRSYQLTIREAISVLGDVPVPSLDGAAIIRFRSSLARLSRASMAIHLTNLRAFLRWFARHLEPGWIPPAIEIPRSDPHPAVDYYNSVECKQLLEASKFIWFRDKQARHTFPFHAFLAVLMFTGLRKNEASQLRWEAPQTKTAVWPWVDLDQGQIVVPAPSAKSRRARFVPILAELRPVLESWPIERRGRLFPFSADGGRIQGKWAEVCKAAGVQKLKLHNLRDTFAVALLMNGVPWAVVGEILGHASVETTKRYYAVIGKAELRSAVGKVSIARTTDLLPT